jgi:RNA polymerase sigma factor for flagellar operon FliA
MRHATAHALALYEKTNDSAPRSHLSVVPSEGWAEQSGVFPIVTPTRDELIAMGIPMVRRIAFRLARRLPPNVEVGDLIGAGTEGLLKAVDRFDAARHASFQPYAEARIRGAILDELRAADSMTRHGRRRLGEVSACIRRLETELGRAPEEEEIAKALGMPLDQYQRLSEDLARGPALARLGELDPDDVASGMGDPGTLTEEAEMRPRLVAALKKLPPRTQQILALYYQEECTQAEIGKIMGVTESRVCQILGEAAARLRAHLEEEEE